MYCLLNTVVVVTAYLSFFLHLTHCPSLVLLHCTHIFNLYTLVCNHLQEGAVQLYYFKDFIKVEVADTENFPIASEPFPVSRSSLLTEMKPRPPNYNTAIPVGAVTPSSAPASLGGQAEKENQPDDEPTSKILSALIFFFTLILTDIEFILHNIILISLAGISVALFYYAVD